MKRTVLALGAAILALAMGAAAQAQTIKLGTLAPKGSPWYENLQDMANDWSNAPGASIKVRIYPGGAIGDESDMVRKMRIGQLQGAVLTAEGLSMIVPEVLALQMPMMFSNDAELDYVRTAMADEFEKLFEARGYKVLNWGDIGWVRLFSNAPVVMPGDMKSLKLFTWAGDVELQRGYEMQGFKPVPLPVPEIFSGLQSGMIDALYAAPVAALSYQWFGLAPHMHDMKVIKLIGATVVTLDTWNKIPEAARAEVLKAGRLAGMQSQEKIRAFEGEAIKVMVEHGLTVQPVTAEQAAVWEKGAVSAWSVYTDGPVPKAFLDRAVALRDEYRKQQAKAN